MAKKKKCPECPAGEKWAVPYADFLSLLLALFIALYAISAQNTEKVKALKTEFIKIFDYAPKPEQAQPVIPIPPSTTETEQSSNQQDTTSNESSAEKSQETISQIIEQGGVLEQVAEGIVLKLPSAIFFQPSASTLDDEDSKLFLRRIIQIIRKLPQSIRIDVRGFANNPNPNSTSYKNDYELAAARALNVMSYLIQNGISPQKIFFSSQGHYIAGNFSNKEEQLRKSNKVEIYFLVKENQGQNVQNILRSFASPQAK